MHEIVQSEGLSSLAKEFSTDITTWWQDIKAQKGSTNTIKAACSAYKNCFNKYGLGALIQDVRLAIGKTKK